MHTKPLTRAWRMNATAAPQRHPDPAVPHPQTQITSWLFHVEHLRYAAAISRTRPPRKATRPKVGELT